MKWISVKDRLPEKTQSYLVVIDGKYIDTLLFNSKTEPYQTWSFMLNKFLFLNERRDWKVSDAVTHWMPLPNLPKDIQE